MESALLPLEVTAFGLAWWLGLYLLGRDPSNPQLRFTGLGLATYALGLAADLLGRQAEGTAAAQALARWGWPLLFLPAFFWFGSLIYLLPEESTLRPRLGRLYRAGLLPAVALFYGLVAGTGLVVQVDDAAAIQPGPAYTLFALFVLLELGGALALVLWALRTQEARRPVGLILTATLFFTLGTVLLLTPLAWPPRWLVVIGIGVDLLFLGLAIAVLDAFDQGETLLPDVSRSAAYVSFAVLLFGGQVVLVIWWGTGLTLSLLALLLATIATAIVTQTLADAIQSTLDNLIFSRLPGVRRERAALRAAASAVPRAAAEKLEPASLDEKQFARLTRRALSHMGNLPRLAASPLTHLSLVDSRVADRGLNTGTLERAAELKALLTESIERLKPRDQGDFGTTDEWRHYNALYFPYVAGLRPYSRRAFHDDLDQAASEALAWFQSQVPERTLYNWQKAAARLVAQDLREQSSKDAPL